ncbi:hypothetical protein PKHYL_30260 [Psychrobacter sp. KH172YL61]|uniref:NAD-dependent epimerase/dehydratase family protein n=1 Tax=Psychrobacter sp. KH172YL61 TaxID=2517899 RepID=UPI0010B8AFA7|nr:NAD-dependent epimerase/dehydratase family protein [Psychrobacter sp. KH172YL61]BBI68835.1 hypothetical protein PKHYL_30260 [Psychrobacter sp. KH172YL61]
MRILVTGARGQLGREIVQCLRSHGLEVIPYSHSMQLSELDWSDITVIVNCAAVIPSNSITKNQYLDGNIVFLQNLLKYSKGKTFIHFSTFSELYKSDFYQLSKMMANSLLLINSHILKGLTILPLPTLEDDSLIEKIVGSASAGLMPKVYRLKYNYMSFKSVAYFVKDMITENDNIKITDLYEKKICMTKLLEELTLAILLKVKLLIEHYSIMEFII